MKGGFHSTLRADCLDWPAKVDRGGDPSPMPKCQYRHCGFLGSRGLRIGSRRQETIRRDTTDAGSDERRLGARGSLTRQARSGCRHRRRASRRASVHHAGRDRDRDKVSSPASPVDRGYINSPRSPRGLSPDAKAEPVQYGTAPCRVWSLHWPSPQQKRLAFPCLSTAPQTNGTRASSCY